MLEMMILSAFGYNTRTYGEKCATKKRSWWVNDMRGYLFPSDGTRGGPACYSLQFFTRRLMVLAFKKVMRLTEIALSIFVSSMSCFSL